MATQPPAGQSLPGFATSSTGCRTINLLGVAAPASASFSSLCIRSGSPGRARIDRVAPIVVHDAPRHRDQPRVPRRLGRSR
jgi:hypothetical protein